MTDEKVEKDDAVERAIQEAKDLFKAAGVDGLIILAGVDTGPAIHTHTFVSGREYVVAKLLFQGGSALAADLRKSMPDMMHLVELECLGEMAESLGDALEEVAKELGEEKEVKYDG